MIHPLRTTTQVEAHETTIEIGADDGWALQSWLRSNDPEIVEAFAPFGVFVMLYFGLRSMTPNNGLVIAPFAPGKINTFIAFADVCDAVEFKLKYL